MDAGRRADGDDLHRPVPEEGLDVRERDGAVTGGERPDTRRVAATDGDHAQIGHGRCGAGVRLGDATSAEDPDVPNHVTRASGCRAAPRRTRLSWKRPAARSSAPASCP
jgi:hypothetical protein